MTLSHSPTKIELHTCDIDHTIITSPRLSDPISAQISTELYKDLHRNPSYVTA